MPIFFVTCDMFEDGVRCFVFHTEREARAFINRHADGEFVYSLYEGIELVVRSAFPVLQIA